VRNVENAYQNGGATATHTKAYGGTIQGRKGDGPMRDQSGTDKPNGFQEEGIGEEQRPNQPTVVGKKWNEMTSGSSTAK
jgi:hypothetical protein